MGSQLSTVLRLFVGNHKRSLFDPKTSKILRGLIVDQSTIEFMELCLNPNVSCSALYDWINTNNVNVNSYSNTKHDYFLNHPRTALHLLAHSNHPQALSKIRLLVSKCDAKVDPNIIVGKDARMIYVTPLYVAVEGNNYDTVKELILYGANIEMAHAADIASPLFFVSIATHDLQMAKVLLSSGASPNVRDFNESYSVLKSTIDVEIAALLLCMGADPNASNKNNCSVLDFAPIRGGVVHSIEQSLPIVKLLLANGADPNHRNNDTELTPANFPNIDPALKDLLDRAEKWMVDLKNYWSSTARNFNLVSLNTTDEVLVLEQELLPFLITPARQIEMKKDLYIHGTKYYAFQQWLESFWYSAQLSLILACREKTGNDFDKLILQKIFYLLSPQGFDSRTDIVPYIPYSEDIEAIFDEGDDDVAVRLSEDGNNSEDESNVCDKCKKQSDDTQYCGKCSKNLCWECEKVEFCEECQMDVCWECEVVDYCERCSTSCCRDCQYEKGIGYSCCDVCIVPLCDKCGSKNDCGKHTEVTNV